MGQKFECTQRSLYKKYDTQQFKTKFDQEWVNIVEKSLKKMTTDKNIPIGRETIRMYDEHIRKEFPYLLDSELMRVKHTIRQRWNKEGNCHYQLVRHKNHPKLQNLITFQETCNEDELIHVIDDVSDCNENLEDLLTTDIPEVEAPQSKKGVVSILGIRTATGEVRYPYENVPYNKLKLFVADLDAVAARYLA